MEKDEKFVHLAYLDGLRAIAALYVLMHHATQQFSAPGPESSLFTKSFFKLFLYGHYSVNLFIVLSGFCLMLPVVRNNWSLKGGVIRFFKGRAKRILPPYYFALGFSLLLIYTLIGEKTGTHWDVSIPVTPRDIITHVLLIDDIWLDTATTINHAFWSIAVEWRIYFLFPVIIWLYRKLGATAATFITFLSSVVILILLSATDLNLRHFGINPQYLTLFGLGVLAAHMSMSSKNSFGWKTVLGAFILSAILYPLGKFFLASHLIKELFPFKDMIFGLFAAVFLGFLSTNKLQPMQKLLSWKPLAVTGLFAYSIYLIHAPLLQVIWQYWINPLHMSVLPSAMLLCFGGAIVIVIISYLFYLIAERPFVNKKAPAKKDPQVEEVMITN